MLNDPRLIQVLSMDLPALAIGITAHEFLHAYAADKLGDEGPRKAGRVSLNPIVHLHPLGTLLPLILGFLHFPVICGWGRPVLVNPERFADQDRGFGVVGLAGPIGNLIVCLLVGAFLTVSPGFAMLSKAMTTDWGNYAYRLLFRIFAINLGLFLFNLLPIPPLDGSKVLMWMGGKRVRILIQRYQGLGIVLILLFLYFGFDRTLLLPLFQDICGRLTGSMANYVLMPQQFVADFLW